MPKEFSKQSTFHFDAVQKIAPGDGSELFAVIDLFSGAGGVTTGIEMAEIGGKKVAEVICAINHDRKAIESHWQNHPHVKHFVEDIRTFNVKNLPKVGDGTRYKLLWASLECTNHSNAKGGLSRDADSRTLAEHLPPYIKEFQPDYIGIENVREFKDWGPLVQKHDIAGKPMFDPKGKPLMLPDKDHRGIDYKRWVRSICKLGYQYEEKLLNAADFGAHTSRKRLFIIFAKNGLPIVWPEPTHSRDGRSGTERWKPVKECLDFSKKGQNIFGRKKNLSDNTYKRIYAGLVKFIAKGDESFLSQYNGDGNDLRVIGTDRAARTVTTTNRFALVQPEFLIDYRRNAKAIGLENTARTLTTHDNLAMIHTEHFVAKYNSSHNNTKQNAGANVNEPSHTVLTRPTLGLVTVERMIDQQFGTSKPTSVESPANAVTTVPKQNLISAFLLNRQYNNIGSSIEKPCFTLIANMNKRPGYLIQMETGDIGIAIEPGDTEVMQKIKMFMAEYGIIAIYMRMLLIPELLMITGFPPDYILEGTQADMKKFIGNAVPPKLPKALIEALGKTLQKAKVAA